MSLNNKFGNNYNHKLPDIEELKLLYFSQNLSSSEIANIYNVTRGAVSKKLKRANINLRTNVESQNLMANHILLISRELNFIDGLLLGDGSIVLAKEKKSACYSHSDKHYKYLAWLINEFAKMNISSSLINHHTNNTFQFRTKYYREFTKIRERWYPKNKKVIPGDIRITPILLFNWYIGDGSYRDTQKSSKKVVICSQFDQDGKAMMSELLKDIGIKTSIYPNSLYIKKDSRIKFFNYMLSNGIVVPDCYKYKFPKEVNFESK